MLRLVAVVPCGRENSPRSLPKSERYRRGINVDLGPPCSLIALAVKLTMMDAAQRYCKFIRYLEADRARLREPKMMCVARLPATHRARLGRNEAKVALVATAARLH